MIKIGCHVGNSGKEMLVGSINEALSYNANALMLYLGAPQNSFRKSLSELNIEPFKEICKNNNIPLENVIVHCAYILNLAQPDAEKRQYAIDFVVKELRGTHAIGAKYLVVHPGAHMKQGTMEGCKRIADSLKIILGQTEDIDTVICLETMAGKGTECCSTFEQMKYILDEVNSPRLKVCLDTCHIFDGGYDIVNNYDEVFNEFDKIVGINNLKVIHVNDSKNICGSHKDRHENIGFGNIGFDALNKVVHDPKFDDCVKILETPYVEVTEKTKVPPYKFEIEMLRNGKFDEDLLTKIKEQ